MLRKQSKLCPLPLQPCLRSSPGVKFKFRSTLERQEWTWPRGREQQSKVQATSSCHTSPEPPSDSQSPAGAGTCVPGAQLGHAEAMGAAGCSQPKASPHQLPAGAQLCACRTSAPPSQATQSHDSSSRGALGHQTAALAAWWRQLKTCPLLEGAAAVPSPCSSHPMPQEVVASPGAPSHGCTRRPNLATGHSGGTEIEPGTAAGPQRLP